MATATKALCSDTIVGLGGKRFDDARAKGVAVGGGTNVSKAACVSFFPSRTRLRFALIAAANRICRTTASAAVGLRGNGMCRTPTLAYALLPSTGMNSCCCDSTAFSDRGGRGGAYVNVICTLSSTSNGLSPALSASPFKHVITLNSGRSDAG